MGPDRTDSAAPATTAPATTAPATTAPGTAAPAAATLTWQSDAPPPALPPLGLRDLLRALRRGLPLAFVTFGCLGLLLALRLVERPLHGPVRPWTPHVTRFVCRSAFRLMSISHRVRGQPVATGAVVANHASWLDIFALNAVQLVYFVAKAEVAGWPGIGWLARATGTVFIRRERREAAAQAEMLGRRLRAGHQLLLFPEGTSTDGQRVLAFRPTLFAAFGKAGAELTVQPVTVCYHAPPGTDPRFYGWWGDMGFGPHLLRVLAQKRQGGVTLTYHPPIRAAEHPDRKSLAAACEAAVRAGRDAD